MRFFHFYGIVVSMLQPHDYRKSFIFLVNLQMVVMYPIRSIAVFRIHTEPLTSACSFPRKPETQLAWSDVSGTGLQIRAKNVEII